MGPAPRPSSVVCVLPACRSSGGSTDKYETRFVQALSDATALRQDNARRFQKLRQLLAVKQLPSAAAGTHGLPDRLASWRGPISLTPVEDIFNSNLDYAGVDSWPKLEALNDQMAGVMAKFELLSPSHHRVVAAVAAFVANYKAIGEAIKAMEQETAYADVGVVALSPGGSIPAAIDCRAADRDDAVVIEQRAGSGVGTAQRTGSTDDATAAIARHISVLHAGAASISDVAQACTVLGSIALTDFGSGAVASAGGVPAVVASLQRHATLSSVVITACHALGNLARQDEHNAAAAASGAVPALMTALTRATSAASAMAACHVLSVMAGRDESRAAITAHDGIPAIVKALEKYAASPSVSAIACYALERLGCTDENRAAIAAAGGVAAIVHALGEHRAAEAVAEAACRALGELATTEDMCATMSAAHAAAAVLSALRAHKASAGVAEAAVSALRTMAMHRSSRACIAAADGIPVIEGVLATHSASKTISREAFAALCELADNAEARARYRAGELRAAGCSAALLMELGFSSSHLLAAGFRAADLRAGCSASELAAAGLSASDLKAVGHKPAQLLAAGFTAAQLKAWGLAQSEHIDACAASSIVSAAPADTARDEEPASSVAPVPTSAAAIATDALPAVPVAVGGAGVSA